MPIDPRYSIERAADGVMSTPSAHTLQSARHAKSLNVRDMMVEMPKTAFECERGARSDKTVATVRDVAERSGVHDRWSTFERLH